MTISSSFTATATATTSNRTIIVTSFLAGFALASTLSLVKRKRVNRKLRSNAGAGAEGEDFSLFWDIHNKSIPNPSTSNDDANNYIVLKDQFLSKQFYEEVVHSTIVCCVDCLIVRYNHLTRTHQCLLLERASHPGKGLWWLPGGRLYKGETFFQGAVRKATQETGLDAHHLNAVQVLGVYNTFFPTSAWDSEEKGEHGTQTVQPIVLLTLEQNDGGERSSEIDKILLDTTSERYRWIGLDPNEAVQNGEDTYVIQALSRLQAWNSTFGQLTTKQNS